MIPKPGYPLKFLPAETAAELGAVPIMLISSKPQLQNRRLCGLLVDAGAMPEGAIHPWKGTQCPLPPPRWVTGLSDSLLHPEPWLLFCFLIPREGTCLQKAEHRLRKRQPAHGRDCTGYLLWLLARGTVERYFPSQSTHSSML